MICTICGEWVAREIIQDEVANYFQHRLVRHHVGNDLAAGIGHLVGIASAVLVMSAFSSNWGRGQK